MAKSPAKRDDIFDLMAQSLSSEDVIDTYAFKQPHLTA